MIDRLPPQSTEAEQSVLGSILIDRDAIVEIAEFLRPEDFYRPANGSVYAAMLELFDKREPVDIVTVAEALERTDQLETVGGRSYLSSLSNQTPTAVHAVQYARIVERKAVLRNLIAAAGKIAGIGYEDPAEIQEAIDRAESELFNVSQRRVSIGFSPLKTLLHDAYDRLDYLHAHRGEISGVRTGFADLDALTTGLQKSDLIVLAARPSVGKTSFALNIAEYAAVTEGRSVGLFSLEMSKEQLVLRLLLERRQHRLAAAPNGLPRGDGLRPPGSGDERPVGSPDVHRRHPEHQRDGAPDEGPPAAGRGRARPRSSWTTSSSCRPRRAPATPTASRRCPRSAAGSRPSPASCPSRSSPCRSCRASPRCARARSHGCRTSASRARSSRTPTWSCSCGATRNAEREDAEQDGEVVNLKLAKHRNGPTGEIQLWFKKRQTRFVSYAGERYADVAG